MKRKMVCLLFLIMFIFTNTAFATNWVLVLTDDNMQANIYIDADKVFKDVDTITFWVSFVYEQPLFFKIKKQMWKYVVNTVRPRTFKWLVAYDYDSNGSELSCDTKGANYGTSLENSGTDKAATLALKYAKEGKDTGEKPTP